MKKFMKLLFALCILFGGLSSLTVQADELTPVKVAEFRGFNWFPTYLAQELGYFEEEGLAVEFVKYNDGPVAFQGMHAGDTQFTLMSQEPVLKAELEGLDSSIILANLDTRIYGFVLGPETESIEDLKGKTIFAGMPGSSPYSFVHSILKENGLDPEKDVTFINMDYGASMAALAQGQIQASYINIDNRIDIENLGIEVKYVVDTMKPEDRKKYLKADIFPGEITVTTRKLTEENPETVQAFVNALLKAFTWFEEASDEEVADLLLPYFDLSSKEELIQKVQIMRPAISKTGYISEEAEHAVMEFNINTGVIDQEIPYNEIIDMTFVEQAQE